MKLFVNARFLTQPISGVQRYGIECSLQIKKLYPETVFLAPRNILHHELAKELNVVVTGRKTGHLWEQLDLYYYMLKQGDAPLLSLANTAPMFYQHNFVTIHDLAFFHHPEWNSKGFSMWYNVLVPRLAQVSRHIFTVTNTVKNEIVQNYKIAPSKISVTYNGISSVAQRLAGPDMEKEKIILSVGTFNVRKNQQNLVKAFIESGLQNEYELVLIGDVNKVFSATGLDADTMQQQRVRVLTGIADSELISFYQTAEIVVSLSTYEGFGIPLLEGLYFRCKILCSDIPVYRELYEGYASFCDPISVSSIVQELKKATEGDKVVEREKVNLLLERFNYERSARTIIEKVSSLCSGSRKGK